MQRKTKSILVAAGVLGLAGTAFAAAGELHVMNVAMPDGSVAQVTYKGDVAPRVVAVPAADQAAGDPFAEMDRMFAEMNARHEAMMRDMARMQAQAAKASASTGPGGPVAVAAGNLPAGSSYSYTVVTSSNGKETCTQTVEWRSDAAGQQPEVTKASSGDCDAVRRDGPAQPAVVAKPVEPAAPAVPAKAPAPSRADFAKAPGAAT